MVQEGGSLKVATPGVTKNAEGGSLTMPDYTRTIEDDDLAFFKQSTWIQFIKALYPLHRESIVFSQKIVNKVTELILI